MIDSQQYDLINFWDDLYGKYRSIYGVDPSLSAKNLVDHLQNGLAKENVKDIVEIGAGTFRNSIFIASEGYRMTGIESSMNAIRIGRQIIEKQKINNIEIIPANIFQIRTKPAYDATFLNLIPNIFLKREREELINRIVQMLRNKGLLISSFLSTRNTEFGNGVLIENNTYLHDDGSFNHFFTRTEVQDILFRHGFSIIFIDHMSEMEFIFDGFKKRGFWFVIAKMKK